MKKLYTISITLLLTGVVVLLAGFGDSGYKSSGGAPAGYTNSPADGQNCSHCMGGTATSVTNWITSDIPSDGYVPGTTYTFTLTATGTGKKGFQISPQDLNGNLIGTLIPGTGNKLIGSGKYLTHSSSPSGNPSSWNFQWTAPAGGAGAVTFYASFAVTKLATKTTTYTVNQSTVGISEGPLTKLALCPNPATDHFTVSGENTQGGRLRLELVNLEGTTHVLSEEPVEPGIWQKKFPVIQPSGIWLLRVYFDETMIATRKVILAGKR
jgi:hypothetical protein